MNTPNGLSERDHRLFERLGVSTSAVSYSFGTVARLLQAARTEPPEQDQKLEAAREEDRLREALRDIAFLRPGGPTRNTLAMQMERIAIDALGNTKPHEEITDAWVIEATERNKRGEKLDAPALAAAYAYELGWEDGRQERPSRTILDALSRRSGGGEYRASRDLSPAAGSPLEGP